MTQQKPPAVLAAKTDYGTNLDHPVECQPSQKGYS